MRVTFLRHGKAADRESWQGDDAGRPLTKAGIEQAREVLRAVRDLVKADEIWTSPWLRARHTAELASGIWKLPLRECAWMAGDGGDPEEWTRRLEGAPDVVLVGHEPDLGRVIGHLLGGPALPLRKTGLAELDGEPREGGMILRAVLPPKWVMGLAEG